MRVNSEYDKPLLVQVPIIHLAIKLDDRARLQAPADLHLEVFSRESGTDRHSRALGPTYLRDDFFGVGKRLGNAFQRHGALAHFVFRSEVPCCLPGGIVTEISSRPE